MTTRVKICGITNAEDAIACANAGADALGFIFYENSPRYVQPHIVRQIIRTLPPFITPVGVFVNETRETIMKIIPQTGIRALQLSGDETPEDCLNYSIPVIKTFRFRTIDEVKLIGKYAMSAAMLDGGTNGQYGGTGVLADFTVAREMKSIHPLILAGGLTPENILRSIEAVEPYAVDINSGVESAPGKKDRHKIQLLFERLSLLHSVTT